uniref:Uncharacterized protein n=1 Tax=Arundo donax TaxID=35708 RepID=A0A0A9CC85_ARUDO
MAPDAVDRRPHDVLQPAAASGLLPPPQRSSRPPMVAPPRPPRPARGTCSSLPPPPPRTGAPVHSSTFGIPRGPRASASLHLDASGKPQHRGRVPSFAFHRHPSQPRYRCSASRPRRPSPQTATCATSSWRIWSVSSSRHVARRHAHPAPRPRLGVAHFASSPRSTRPAWTPLRLICT